MNPSTLQLAGSTITTASAPSGMLPPVCTSAASPNLIRSVVTSPMRTSPITRSTPGVELARTA